MSSLGDNLRHWRDNAKIDWFSQFIKAWIPFNAWMTDSFGDKTDRELLDRVKSGNNSVYNGIIPILNRNKNDVESAEFLLNIAELNNRLQSCILEGRKGRISFACVDIGANNNKDEKTTKWRRDFRVRRDYPNKGEITLELTGNRSSQPFNLTLSKYDRQELEDNHDFAGLKSEQRSTFLSMLEAVAPRKNISVLAKFDDEKFLEYDTTKFIDDPSKIFCALIDVTYNLRNALFHGSISPTEQHNEIYEPAYYIVMRFVKCTI